MASMTLSLATQNAINLAITAGPGVGNQNFIAAYNAVSADIASHGGFNTGTLNWFAQAASVNAQAFSASAAGTYIWNYTIAAAKAQGATLSSNDLQAASNAIGSTVFTQLVGTNFVFTDSPSAPSNFSPKSITQYDAGAGLAVLRALHPEANLTPAVWGGTLFARTQLGYPEYFVDRSVDLTPGSRDCDAITYGSVGAVAAVTANLANIAWNQGPSAYSSMTAALRSQDNTAIKACFPNQHGSLEQGNSVITLDGAGTLTFTLRSTEGLDVRTTSIGPDNSIVLSTIDESNSEQWSRQTSVVDAQDHLKSIDKHNDNGSRAISGFDDNGNERWSFEQEADGSAIIENQGTKVYFASGQLADVRYGLNGAPLFVLADGTGGLSRTLRFDANTGNAILEFEGQPPISVNETSKIELNANGSILVREDGNSSDWSQRVTLYRADGSNAGTSTTYDIAPGWMGDHSFAGFDLSQVNETSLASTLLAIRSELLFGPTDSSGIPQVIALATGGEYRNGGYVSGWESQDPYIDWYGDDFGWLQDTIWKGGAWFGGGSGWIVLPEITVNSPWSWNPVILDLDGNGVSTTPFGDSLVYFDIDSDGYAEQTAWVGPNDGFLAIDLSASGSFGADGLIALGKEINFGAWTSEEDTDLEALKTIFDTNGNNKLDAGDLHWADFRVWQDVNGDGSSQSGELTTLASRGITEVSLVGNGHQLMLPDGSMFHGMSTYQGSGGVTREVGDVSLRYAANGFKRVETSTGFKFVGEDGSEKVFQSGNLVNVRASYYDHVYDVYTCWVVPVYLNGPGHIDGHKFTSDGYFGFQYPHSDGVTGWWSGNVVVAFGTKPVTLIGGSYTTDFLKGGDGDDIIDGGWREYAAPDYGVYDVLLGGGGNDTIYLDATSWSLTNYPYSWAYFDYGTQQYIASPPKVVDGGDGYDTAVLRTPGSVTVSLADRNFEAFISNDGNDTITANPNVGGYIVGGGGNDTIFGSAHDDILAGDNGNDVICAGDGVDLVQGGNGDDALSGQGGDDNLFGGDGVDVLTGGLGDDTITGGAGSDVFVFNSGFGHDIVRDFVAGNDSEDLLEFDHSVLADFNALIAAASTSGSDTIISADAYNTVVLQNVDIANLHQDDFRFV